MLVLPRRSYLAVWPLVALAAWTAFVPGTLSVTVFAWLNLGVLATLVLGAMFRAAMAPNPSVAQLLHDVENDQATR